jgi:protein-ribulosamine 3-kinase
VPAKTDFAAIAAALSAATGARFASEPAKRVVGGCINHCFEWRTTDGSTFVKLAAHERLFMFESEAAGLRELATAGAVRVPTVLAMGHAARHAFLALEWIAKGATSARSQLLLGEQLAAQHRVGANAFGWDRDNTIGLTPQRNAWAGDWHEFFREHRLRFQLELAERNGFGDLLRERGVQLLDAVPALLAGHQPAPSLLHGDLWGGNWLTNVQGEPVIFDPAVYFGDREADLAMTHLFGGFASSFYAAYEAAWPLAPGSDRRCELYNLYHVLNHANLFGVHYARQAASTIDRLLATANR